MYDTGKILGGLAIFVVLITAPAWYALATGHRGAPPKLELPAGADGKHCIESSSFMRAEHMQLLDDWRDSAVRGLDRDYLAADGETYRINLSDTRQSGACFRCHSHPAQFCDKCHAYLGVEPYCWDCHQRPGEK